MGGWSLSTFPWQRGPGGCSSLWLLGVPVIHHYATIPPNLSETATIVLLLPLPLLGVGQAQPGASQSIRVFPPVAIRCQLGLESSRKSPHSYNWWPMLVVSWDLWTRTPACGLSPWPELPHSMAAGFQEQESLENKVEAHGSFLSWLGTFHKGHFCGDFSSSRQSHSPTQVQGEGTQTPPRRRSARRSMSRGIHGGGHL